MKSRLLTLLVLAGLAFWLFQAGRDADRNLSLPSGGGRIFAGVLPDTITSLYLKLSFGQDILLERERGGVWQITAPGEDLALQELVAQVITNLLQTEVVPLPERRRNLELADVGLEPPEHIVRFW